MGYVYLYTGTGGGKTTNALGLALRTVGHRRTAVIIQFLKWRQDIGEYQIREMLAPYYEIYQFGRPVWLGRESRVEEYLGEKFSLSKISEVDKELAEKALNFAYKILEEKKPHLLVLDEINLAAHWNLLSVKEIIAFLDAAPDETTVVLTGRYAPKELIDRADFVNEIKEVKMPKSFTLTKGIQY
jgi:cob(I)alamin adenosyltransferase